MVGSNFVRDGVKNWIPAPRFRGDKFTPAKAGAGMTVLRVVLD